MSQLLDLYRSLGNERYAGAITQLAPYFGTINPKFKDLRPGFCAIVIPNTRAVHNHLGTMHAIAICNGAELVGGLTTDVSIPAGRRWIPVEMSVRYLAKATTDVTVICDGQTMDWSAIGNIVVPVAAADDTGKHIFQASITMNISPEK